MLWHLFYSRYCASAKKVQSLGMSFFLVPWNSTMRCKANCKIKL